MNPQPDIARPLTSAGLETKPALAEAIKQTPDRVSAQPRLFFESQKSSSQADGLPRWQSPVASVPVLAGNIVSPATCPAAPVNQPASGARKLTPVSGSPRKPVEPVAAQTTSAARLFQRPGDAIPISSNIPQPLTTVGEATGSFPGRVRKGPPGNYNPDRC
jgi:hypothetical protein